ncbi:MAG: SAM-dependent methyltransferase [Rhodospirillaceae bacterium]|nr:SAM-dependent methyltransferase [Rhodospirillaceae bacterium]
MTPLDRTVRRMIAQTGPMPVSRFMALALQHPEHGYYRSAAAIGRSGDFITAPEISQVFGELVGLWLAEAWDRAGRPDPCILCEAGPGRGVLMADVLRAVRRVIPDFAAAARLHLIESNETLRAAQAEILAEAAPVWVEGLDGLPDGPLFLIANEFLDALPVRQFAMTPDGWRERTVALGEDGRLVFAAAADSMGDPAAAVAASGLSLPETAETGGIGEIQPAALAFVREAARRIVGRGGAALLVDYGGNLPAGRSTLRGIRGHRLVDPLDGIGATDLSVDVDFGRLRMTAEQAGATVLGPVEQAGFLRSLGVEARRAALKASAAPEDAAAVDAAIDRLLDPAGMGTAFKAMAVAAPSCGPLPGFSP